MNFTVENRSSPAGGRAICSACPESFESPHRALRSAWAHRHIAQHEEEAFHAEQALLRLGPQPLTSGSESKGSPRMVEVACPE